MPAKKIFSYNNSPVISVVIPSLDGDRNGNVKKLIDDIKNQSFKPIEIILSINEKPNGHARNVGFKLIAKSSEIVCFFDDDVTLGSRSILNNFYKELKDTSVGLVGASQLAPLNSSLFQRWVAYDLNKATSSIKSILTDSEMVTHAGLACRIDTWNMMKGEDDSLVTGTDTDLRERLRALRYRVVIAPNTFVYHPLPNKFLTILKNAKFHGEHQLQYRMKHGFQNKFYSAFMNVTTLPILSAIIIRELLFFFPHLFLSKEKFFFGFRPINASFRLIMVIAYSFTCYKISKKND